MIFRKILFLFFLSAFLTVNSYSITEKEAVEQINTYFQTGMPAKAISLASRFTSQSMQRLKFIAAVKAKSLNYAERTLPRLQNPDGELYYYIGLFYELKGDYKKAMEMYTAFSGDNMFYAISLFAAGRCAEKLDDLRTAKVCYDKASASSFSPPGVPEKALPADFSIKKSGRIVRACLGEGILSVTVTLGSNDENVDITCQDGKIVLLKNGRIIDKKNSGYKIFCKDDKGTVTISNIMTTSITSVNLPSVSTFRGQIEFLIRDNALMLVNHIDLEEYLCGVLPSEMFSSWPDEALKAQAVAARSYILLRMLSSGKKDYDVYIVKNTAYRGYLRENPRTTMAVDDTFGIAMFNKANKPLDALFCTNCGGYSTIPYTAWGGTSIEANADFKAIPDKKLNAWQDVPAAGQVAQFIKNPPPTYSYVPAHIQYQSYRWAVQSTRKELEELLDPEHSIGYIKGIYVVERDISGRAVNVKISGTQGEIMLNTARIRKQLGGLKSSLFICEYENSRNGLPDVFTFIGAGRGHGVGLCQSGAAGMALDGIGYREILKHYYPLADIRKYY